MSKWATHRYRAEHSERRTSRLCMRAQKDSLVQLSLSTGKALNVHRCGTVWDCPVCSPSERASRGRVIDRVAELAGGSLMVTLTTRHHRNEPLADVHQRISKGWKLTTSGRGAWACKDFVRTLEVTAGSTGWHPHLHVIIFGDSEKCKRAAVQLVQRWQSCTPGAMGAAQFFSEWVSPTESRNGVYVTKLSAEVCIPQQTDERWDARAIWEAARLGVVGVEKALEFERVIRGRKWLTWGSGVKELKSQAELEIESEDAPMSEKEESEVIAYVPSDVWNSALDGGWLDELVSQLQELHRLSLPPPPGIEFLRVSVPTD